MQFFSDRMNGSQLPFSVSKCWITYQPQTTMKAMMTVNLTATMKLLTFALSETPTTSSAVSAMQIRKAGRLKIVVTALPAGVRVGALAWDTRRTLHVRHERLEPHRAVNRLVLARACALVGALVAAGYAAYAVTWVGDASELAGQRVLRSAVAAAAGVAIVISSLLLERACRLPSRENGP